MRKVRGIGINDTEMCGPACTIRDEQGRKKNYPDYSMWYGMLVRCTCAITKIRHPSYKDTYCEDSWLLRSNFKNWYDSQGVYFDNLGNILELDKDTLLKGNNVYSPKTCALVPKYINTLMREARYGPQEKLMWVKFDSRNGKLKKAYRSEMFNFEGKLQHLGYFETEFEAHVIAQNFKIKTIENILNYKYVEEKCFRQDVYDAVLSRATEIKNQINNFQPTTRFY